MKKLSLSTSLQGIFEAYLARDAAGVPCLRHAEDLPWKLPRAIGCPPQSPYQENIQPLPACVPPDFLLHIRGGAVLKHNRSPLCIDIERNSLLAHPAMDMVFCRDPDVWRSHLTNIGATGAHRLPGRSLLLDARYGKEFYHFSVSVLGRLARFLSFGRELDSVDHVILPEPTSHVVAWADLLAIPAGKRVYLGEGVLLHAGELLVPSNTNDIDMRTIDFIRNRFRGRTTPPRRNLFISRARSLNGRHLLDEEGLIRDVFVPRGFDVVRLEEMTPREQAETMASARHVVAVHGGGLTNLVHCVAGTRVLELFSPKWIVFCYARLCSLLGLESSYHVGDDVPGLDTSIPRERLERVVDEFLG